ncbi:cytochrome P450 [Trametes coccinea BRFM310]|uniref:Cytochrome P450 n=1 Tax=Trametes coccinea (strain BRFM310) TaxID=1353009 RepID=A0A1Y2IRV6_TRAC3|nr:cytochrome P450 [Trametes coccinea BRFM310]
MAFHSSLAINAAILTAFVLAVVVVRAAYHRNVRDGKLRYPPGPPPVLVLGNVHQLPVDYQHRKLAEWGTIYGDVVFARFFRTPAVVLNSREAAIDLLEKRSAKYSDRPRFILLSELMGWDSVLNNLPYGERFRKHRKWLQDAFVSKQMLATYRPIQRRETYTLLSGLCETPQLFMDHIKRWAAATIMEIAYGHRVTSIEDKYIELAERATVETVKAGSPGSMLVDFFPILKGIPLWAPGSGFKHRAYYVRGLIRKTLDTPFEMVKRALLSGTAAPSFTANLLEEAVAAGSLTAEHETDIKGAAGVIYAAGTDTTVTAMKSFILAMVLHPAVYKKAQAEIDRVVGSDRLPDWEDMDSLPYLDAVLKEVFRWNPPVPLGVPHSAQSDDVYRGCHIPKGAMMIPNIWWMTHDPDEFPEPNKFDPERFLSMSPEEADRKDPRKVVFGFGRRICPGQAFAEAGVWLAAANIIATMDLTYAKDKMGRDIVPEAAFISGFVSHPQDFACAFRPRSERIRELISSMNSDAADTVPAQA